MARRADTPIWVQGLRTQLRSTLGPAFRIGEQRGRAKLDVRFIDGSRGTAVLPVQWVPAQARAIQLAVEHVAQQLALGRSLRQALEQLTGTTPPAPQPALFQTSHEILNAWQCFGRYKVERTGQIKESTWKNDYGKRGMELPLALGKSSTSYSTFRTKSKGNGGATVYNFWPPMACGQSNLCTSELNRVAACGVTTSSPLGVDQQHHDNFRHSTLNGSWSRS